MLCQRTSVGCHASRLHHAEVILSLFINVAAVPSMLFQHVVAVTDMLIFPIPARLPACRERNAVVPCMTAMLSGMSAVLQGGSTLFKGFAKRLQRDLKRLVDARLKSTAAVDVCVRTHHMQQHAAWFGGSILGNMPSFEQQLHTRAQYEEHGPGICRSNAVFGDI